MWRWLWLTALVVGLDRFTKVLAEAHLDLHQQVPVMPFFDLTLRYNTGAAFSLLADAGGWQRWLFAALAVVLGVVLVVWLGRLKPEQRWQAAGVALVLGGALGNLWDRVVTGEVVDFVLLYYKQWSWPAFNVADSAITVGAAILVVDSLLAGRREADRGG
jgi:signal peptidase II